MYEADDSYIRQTSILEKKLLVIDDYGMQLLDEMSRMMLLEIIEDRHQKLSTNISPPQPVEN